MVTYCRRVHVQGTFQTSVARPMAQHESSRVVKHGPAKNLLGRNTAQQRLFDRNSVHKKPFGPKHGPAKNIGPKHGPGKSMDRNTTQKTYWAETRPK
jgi:hypothetical protein